MRKAFIYIFLPIFLFNGSLGEVFKLDRFIVHFTEHQAADSTLGLFDFIYMHYIGDDRNSNDQDKDMELPFKKIDCHFSFQIASFPDPDFVPESRFETIDSYLKIAFRSHSPKNPALAVLQQPPCSA